MPNTQNKIVHGNASRTPAGRSVCSFAASSILFPIFCTVWLRRGEGLRYHTLDDALGFSPRGMFWTKLAIVAIPCLIGIALACWSLRRIPRNPLLYGRALAFTAIALNIACILYAANTVYSLYYGYL
jgi:hypothetical protein